MGKEIKIGPKDVFGETGKPSTSRMMRMMVLSMEKKRIRESNLPLNALGGTQSKVEFDDLRRVVKMTIELPFSNEPDWEKVKKVAQEYTGEQVLVIV